MRTIPTSPVASLIRLGTLALAAFGLASTAMAQGPGKIAYVADSEIWMMEADGSGKEALGLAATDFDAYDVQLSPSGEWLVFNGVDFDSGDSGLFLMRAEAYSDPNNFPALIGPDSGIFKRASWHPGGGWVAYIGNDNKVYLVEALDGDGAPAGGTPETITADGSPVWVTDVAFEPAGRNLLICQFGADLALIEVFDANGARTANEIGNPLSPITSQAVGRAAWPSFSPDGKKIVFQSTKQYNGTLPGSNPPVNGFVTEIAIATLTIRDNAGALVPEHDPSNLRQYLGDPVHFIDPPLFVDNAPTWSPDGSKIVFVDYVEGSPGHKRIVSLNAATPESDPGNPRVVLAGDGSADVDYPSFAHPGGVTLPANPAPVPPNLISWWPAENAAWDVAGIGEGSMKNSEDFDPYDVGKVGRAFWFDGIDDHVQCRSGGMSLVQNFSIEVWVKPLSHSTEQAIVSKKNPGDDDVSYSLLLRDGKPLFRASLNGIEHEMGPSNVTLPLDEWSHLVFTENADEGRLKLYLNGEIVGLTAAVPPRPLTTGPLTIGAIVDDTHPTATPGSPFDGLVDELSLYNRALSGTEIGLIHAAGKDGKARHDPARDFSATSNPNLPWRYGWVDRVTRPIPGTEPEETTDAPIPSYLTDGELGHGGLFPPRAALDVDGMTQVYDTTAGTAINDPEPDAHLLFNKSKTTRATASGDGGATQIEIAARQFAFHPADDGDYAVLQWVAPEEGKYALSATFTGVEDAPATTDVYLYRGDTELFKGSIDSFLGDGTSATEEVNLSEDDTVTWIVGGGETPGLDYTGVVASAVRLDDFLPFARPEITAVQFNAPLMNGKSVTFIARNGQKDQHPGMTARLQYSATPGVPGSWVDLPGGILTSDTSLTFKAILNTLPVGTIAFRVATTVGGLGTTFSAPSETFTVLAKAAYYEIELDARSASDPNGVTTHPGDYLTYTARFRNRGGLVSHPVDRVQILIPIPAGTNPVIGSSPGYEVVVAQNQRYAVWTLDRTLNLADAQPRFTVSNLTTDVMSSPNHGLEDGDRIQVKSTGVLPRGLGTTATYVVFSSTSNQFKLRNAANGANVNLLSAGTGVHTWKRVDSWQRRTLRVLVHPDPLTTENTVIPYGQTYTSFGRIRNRFSGIGGGRNTSPFTSTLQKPLSVIASPPVAAVSPLRQGGEVSVDFTVKNKASYAATGVVLNVTAPVGLTLRGGVYTSGSGNPVFGEDSIGKQFLRFDIGTLAPGAQRVCQARFRVQYDWDTVGSPQIPFDHAVASMSPPRQYVPASWRYVRIGKKTYKVRVPAKFLDRRRVACTLGNPFDLTIQAAPLNQPRPILKLYTLHHGIGHLPEDLAIQMVSQSNADAPTGGFATTHRQNQILFQITYENLGTAPAEFLRANFFLPDNSTYVANSAVVKLPEAAVTTHRDSGNAANDVLTASAPHGLRVGDRVTFSRNAGGLIGPARTYVVKWIPNIASPTTFQVSAVPGGAVVNLTANFTNLFADRIAFAVAPPTQTGSLLEFPLPYLDSVQTGNNRRTLEFLVNIHSSLVPGDTISQTGAAFTSRDLAAAEIDLTTRRARVVAPAKMDYDKGYSHEVITDGNGNPTGVRQAHSVVFKNTGSAPATGVTITFTYPQGLEYEGADYLDYSGRVANFTPAGRLAPVHDEGARTVTFEVGTVAANGSANRQDCGFVQLRLTQNRGPVPTSGTGAYQTPVTYRPDDDSTGGALMAKSAAQAGTNFEANTGRLPSSLIDFDLPIPATAIQGQLGAYRNEELTYQVTVMNLSDVAQRSAVFFPTPAGTEFVEAATTDMVLHCGPLGYSLLNAGSSYVDVFNPLDPDTEVIPYPDVASLNPRGGAVYNALIQPGGAYTVHFKVRVLPDAPLNAPFFAFAHALQGGKVVPAGAYTTLVLDPFEPEGIRNSRVSSYFLGPINAAAQGTADRPNEKLVSFSRSLGHLSKGVLVTGADLFQLINGAAVVPTRNGNVIALSANVVANDGAGLVGQDGAGIVAGGGGNIVAGGGGNFVNVYVNNLRRMSANELIGSIPQIVAGGGGNLIKNEGLNLIQKKVNLVGQDGASLIGNDGASLIGQDGASIATLIANTDGVLTGFKFPNGNTLNIDPSNQSLAIAAGVVENGLAKIVVGDGTNLLDRVNLTIQPKDNIVAGGGGNIVAGGGGNIVAGGGGNIVAGGGGNIVAAGGGNVVANDGAGITAGGGGN